MTDNSWGHAVVSLPGPAFQIPETLGRTVGNNLFESFQTFNLASGESATFTGSANIVNVLARVTGGCPSTIDGSLTCDIPHANLFFINPAGVIFGSHSSVNVSGSFAVTTANYIKLGGNGRFDASHPANDLLSVAPPSAFGFLAPAAGTALASVTLHSARLAVDEGQTLSVVAEGVTLDRASPSSQISSLQAPGGRIQIAAVNSAGEVGLADNDTSAFAAMGSTVLKDGSVMSASSSVADSGNIDIATGSLTLADGSQINTGNYVAGHDGNGGNVTISATSMSLSDGSWIDTENYTDFNWGNSGKVKISTGTLNLTTGSWIDTENWALGDGGSISIAAGTISLSGSEIITQAHGLGNSGDINVAAGSVDLIDSQLSAQKTGTGNGGNINVAADSVDLIGSTLSAQENGIGNAGTLTLSAGKLTLSSTSELDTSLGNDGVGRGGNINLDLGGSLSLLDGSWIESRTLGTGPAGNINILAKNIVLGPRNGSAYGSSILADAVTRDVKAGDAGSISIRTETLNTDDGTISASSGGAGNAGNIDIQASQSITLDHRSWINNYALLNSAGEVPGSAGIISLTAPTIKLENHSTVSSQVESSSAASAAGLIRINATDSLILNSGAGIVSSDLLENAEPVPGSTGGNILINCGHLDVDGADTIIDAATLGSRSAGSISINAGSVSVSNHGLITSSCAGGTGDGGNVSIISSGTIAVTHAGSIDAGTYSDAQVGLGNAGSVRIIGKNIDLSGGSISSDSFGADKAGTVSVAATDQLTMTGDAAITAESYRGTAGDLEISAGNISILGGSRISSSATGPFANAGSISIGSDSAITLNQGMVFVTSSQADAGTVILRAPGTISLTHSGISATAYQNGGNVDIRCAILGLSASAITADATKGDGGHINLVADLVYSLGLSLDDAITAKSQNPLAQPGTVSINSAIDLANSLVDLPGELVTQKEQLRDGCARKNPKANSFILRGFGGLPMLPDSLCPSYDLLSFGPAGSSR